MKWMMKFDPRRCQFVRGLLLLSLLFSAVCGLARAATAGVQPVPEQPPLFSSEIRPLLSRYCFACHGPDEGARQADLRLDLRTGLFTVSSTGQPMIKPGDPAASVLFQRVSSKNADLRMPPAELQHQLNTAQVEMIEQWIAAGAEFDEHWSFRPPAEVEVPAADQESWGRNEIDAFVQQRLQKEGLPPSAEANRATLVRRLSLDLTGLPPSEELLQQFARDESEESYQRLVDHLLQSEHYGEQWARHWLDLAHYADSDGYLGDAMRPWAWLYRDWLINSLNKDQPFDEFTIEQLAGDLLPDASLQQKIATGFLRNTLTNTEAGVDLEEYRLKEITDRVSTLGTGWLGLSVGCAECHSHKYDPISQREFYQLFAFFNDADDVEIPAASETEMQAFQETQVQWQQRLQELRAELNSVFAVIGADDAAEDTLPDVAAVEAALLADAKKLTAEQKQLLTSLRNRSEPTIDAVTAALRKHAGSRPQAPTTKARTVAARKETRETWVHVRGNYRQRGDTVTSDTPAFLPPLQKRATDADRLDLARWVVSKENPLTARVTVNRWWSHLFGRGLVESVDNFGSGGSAPSHPQLLDWLAGQLVERGWSRKEMLRLMVTSSTYRQSSAMREDLQQSDPQNVLLARQGRFRMTAEQIRDAALVASGLLHRRVGGPGIRPPQPDYVAAISRNVTWEVTEGPDLYRRGVYVLLRRATPYPMLQTFDAPDSTVACVQRERTNSPLQALTLLNDPVFVECADALGAVLAGGMEETNGAAMDVTKADILVQAFRRCLGREPSTEEQATLLRYYRSELQGAKTNPQDALEDSDPAIVHSPEQRAWTAVARVLLNLDEFITRE